MTVATYAAQAGDWLRGHAHWLRRLQWGIVLVYATLLVVPPFLPLPTETDHALNNLTVLAQFAFWGVWWPFVLVSMPLFGRAWCGWLCPEGMLSEWASERGLRRPIPRWMRWGGWPFVAFALTTIYGQLVSVYQYPLAVLLVLGGSTVAAVAVGLLYGSSKRVWCRYLCPVNGVFNLLARLAPWHFKVDHEKFREPGRKVIPINCAPLVAIGHMQGAGDCHMCGRCSGYRDAVTLAPRSLEAEIVEVADSGRWPTLLIVYGMMGIALGAFAWSSSPWLVTLKQDIATWLINRDIYWPLDDGAPWWLLTHYPEVNDSFSWLDGSLVLGFILGTAAVVGSMLLAGLWAADHGLPGRGRRTLDQLAQGLIPLAGVGVFLGLSMTTVTLLKHEGLNIPNLPWWRAALLSAAALWSLRLLWRLARRRGAGRGRSLLALSCILPGLGLFLGMWVLLFYIW